MAYLSSTAVIIDAILTKQGREILMAKNKAFNISHYAFGDDEIDYGLLPDADAILSTPILEASTDEDTVLQYRLLTGLASSATKVAQIILEPMVAQMKEATLMSIDISTDTEDDVINEEAFYTIINEHPSTVDIYYIDKEDFIVYDNTVSKQKIRARERNGKGNFLVYTLSSSETAIYLKVIGQKSGARQDFTIQSIKESLTAFMQ